MNTGSRIQARRKQLGMSQEELAHLTGTNQKQISRYENNKNDITGDKLIVMARVLQTTTDWVLGLTDNPEQPMPPEQDWTPYEREILTLMHNRDEEYQKRVVEIAKLVN
jgi:transcriptional regulator with XRE-family HTH domain